MHLFISQMLAIVVISLCSVVSASPQSCGVRPPPDRYIPSIDPRLAAGGRSSTVIWPWMTAIFNENKEEQICGGTLITDWHIITAAHCFDDSRDPAVYHVEIGEIVLDASNTKYEVESIKVHEDYSEDRVYNDIAIVTLTQPIPPELTPVCFLEDINLLEGFSVSILGWGHTRHGGEKTKTLQEVHALYTIEHERCNKLLQKIIRKDSRNFRRVPYGITDTLICAGVETGGKDACNGDSGGPLLRQDVYGYWHLAGIVSFGFKCAKRGFPGVYVRATAYIDWIKYNIGII